MKITMSSAACLALLMVPLALVHAATSMEDLEKMESWSYVPNENSDACVGADVKSWGCCGKPEDGKERCGPNNWIHINETTTIRCANTPGNQQSPINFQTVGKFRDIVSLKKEDAAMTFSGHKCEAKVEFKEGTWEVVIPDDCGFKTTINGVDYKLLQFHFHNAEHTVNYAYMPLEVHLVHQSVEDKDQIVVLSTFFAPGTTSKFFEDLQKGQDNANPDNPDLATKNQINAYDVLPKNMAFWHYIGSLTTPPCQMRVGSTVKWYVFKTPNTLSYEQLYFFTSYFRDLPLANNGRISRNVQDVLEETTIYSFP